MTKSALLIEMIGLMRNQPGITVNELANALDRSERTMYRWLNELSVDLKTPLYCSNGGYYLLNGLENKKTDLIPEELLALRLSLKSSPFCEGSSIKKHAESAWHKVKATTPSENIAKAVDCIESHSIKVTTPETYIKPSIVDALENAINNHHRLHIVYRSQKSNQVNDYTIDPYAIVFRRHNWYVLAYCAEHEKVIQLKLVRFKHVENTGVGFDLPPDFSVEDYFKLSWEAWAGDEIINARIKFSSRVAQMIAESKRHPTQKTYPQPDDSIILEVTVAGINEIAVWVMGYGKDAVVLEPKQLRDYILEHAVCMVAHYATSEKNISTTHKDSDIK